MKELHVGIKNLYSSKNIPMLHSCLNETISTAIERFEQMSLLEKTEYKSKKGEMTVFLRSPADNISQIRKVIEQILKNRNFEEKDLSAIFTETDDVIMRTMTDDVIMRTMGPQPLLIPAPRL